MDERGGRCLLRLGKDGILAIESIHVCHHPAEWIRSLGEKLDSVECMESLEGSDSERSWFCRLTL